MEQAYLSFIWWNTSLSPPLKSKRGKANNQSLNNVCSVIEILIFLNYDFICLGEVCDEDIDFIDIKLNLASLGYSVVKGAKKLNRSYFDTCIIHKSEHLLVPILGENTKYLAFDSGTNQLKIATKFYFQLAEPFNSDLVVYLSHWPSKLKDNYLNTGSISERCRMDIEMQLEGVENIILMGDYNVEPYEDAIVHNLQTSRDKDVVLAKPTVFYNPCWKFLIESPEPYESNNMGTYFYSSGRFHKKLVLDQIIFSPSFLKGNWIFKDEYVNILSIDKILGISVKVSDHLPISAIVGRKII